MLMITSFRVHGRLANKPDNKQVLPTPEVAACAIWSISHIFVDSNEPSRRAAWELGWYDLDGTEWWDSVMEMVARGQPEQMLA